MRGRNPYLYYYEMQSVLSRSLEIYQRGHFGRVPKKSRFTRTPNSRKKKSSGRWIASAKGPRSNLSRS